MKQLHIFRRVALLLAFLMFFACSEGGGDPTTGTVEGYVSSSLSSSSIDSQAMLSGVVVSIGGRNATTNSNGYYVINELEAGSRSIMASSDGYQAYSSTVTVIAEQTVSHNISLSRPSPQEDTSPPSVPTGLTTTEVAWNQIGLSWSASTDNVGVTGYKLYRDGTFLINVSTTFTSDDGLAVSTQYCYEVTAIDAAGNESPKSNQVCPTTPLPPDTNEPSAPTGLTATPSSSQINLAWTASTDNVGVTGYKVYRGGTFLKDSSSTSTSDEGLSSATSYCSP